MRSNCAPATRISLILFGFWAACGLMTAHPVSARTQESEAYDVVVYGATPAGISAAIASSQDGCSVLLVEPTHQIGGLLTSGLSHTDYHSRESLSGAFLHFARRVKKHYEATYGPDSQQVIDCHEGVFAEPKVNLLVLEKLLAESSRIEILRNTAIKSLVIDPPSMSMMSIRQIVLSTNQHQERRIRCAIAIDATYEGDLMAMAGVPWRAGREGRNEYGESLAPEQPDDQLQAYNFRFVMTRDPSNRIMPKAPPGYQRDDFVGVLDAIGSGKIKKVFDYPRNCIFKAHLPPLPNAKYDINDVSQNLVRLSLPGKNRSWPNGSSQERRAIFDDHLRDQVGLLYFLQNDPAVPGRFREEAQEWGWCRDEFIETDHLPPQLYVREARRMLGKHVYVQKDSEHAPNDARAFFFADSIASGDYGNNCHGTAHEGPRFGGQHTGEFYNPVPPYQIPYGVLVPNNIQNLLVPGAVSASHVGFCALRLEPIWMSLGQAAGHAAAQSIQRKTSVQDVAIKALQHRLHQAGSATIYVSDVHPEDPDFLAVQWWGALGGLHGLAPMPKKPGQRGRNLHGQYFEANPGHDASLAMPLDASTATRWQAISRLAGLPSKQLPAASEPITRGEFIRAAYAIAVMNGLVNSKARIPRLHPDAIANQHAPGEVDNLDLLSHVQTDPSQLPGIVVDDSEAILVGSWQYSTHTPPYVGLGYLHDRKEDKGKKSVTYIPTLTKPGIYEVRISYCSNVRRASNTQLAIRHADGETQRVINQQQSPEHDKLFHHVGRFRFEAGRDHWVRIINAGDDGKVAIADAVQFLWVE
jgi:hypothetical protein